ncbi:hypothetical protein GXN76_06280 [Kroppenstedtia pulmonis]|uniref:SGNH hydrolase-type esterase domain-containing protein n=1 Tax=Kroppenstedtia pulmonis TaxID=1380685 RepID=A0A7D3XQ49_9BACL|nr:GDSL-type esterase/lipase family protein [Kroppenstedtia pulmonis]QKG84122.1 hypothetical protein GXN76_06280 [Kroppenstedtia pulmonis]
MNKKGRGIWITFCLLTILSAVILVTGFVMATSEVIAPQKNPVSLQTEKKKEQEPGEKRLLLGLGDSLTRGTGDADGKGYFGRIREAVRKQYGPVSAVNLGIKGQTSKDLSQQVKQKRVRELLRKADWITLTIGGNDLFRGSGSLEQIDLQKAETTRDEYEKHLTSLLTEIRKQNQDAPIFIFGLYNPFGGLKDQEQTSRLVMEWNQTIIHVSQEKSDVVVIPIYDLFQHNPKHVLYTDRFHPNHRGYSYMAERLGQALHLENSKKGENES